MDLIDNQTPVNVERTLDDLARRYQQAGNTGIDVLNLIGGKAEGLLDRLPVIVRERLQDSTAQALRHAMTAAHASRAVIPDQKSWLNHAATSAMGAVGGAGGLPTALAELPVTTALLLRVIEGVAEAHGFDTNSDAVQYDCVTVFSAAGPLEADDGADLGFISARVTLTGAAVQGLLARVAPRLATVLGQKLAAQTVPILGAVAGAATNYAYTRYYQEMAHVHFGVRRLALEADVPLEEMVDRLRKRVSAPVK